MNKIAIAALALLLSCVASFAQTGYGKVEAPWYQQGKIGAGISVTNSSAATALPAAGQIAWVCNTGANDAYLAFGTANTIVATVAGSSWLKAGTCGNYDLLPFGTLQKFVAAITGSSTTTLTVETGIGTGPQQLATSSGSGGGTSSAFNAAFPANGTAIGMSQGGNMVALNGTAGNLLVNCAVGCSGGTFNNNADAVATSSSNGQAAAWLYGFNGTTYDRLRVDAAKNLLVGGSSGSFVDGAIATMGGKADAVCGTATGTCSEIALLKFLNTSVNSPPPLNLNGTNTAWTGLTPGVAQTGTIVAANVDQTSKGGVAYGAMANYGTSPGAVKVDGVNAFVTNFGTGTAGSAAGGVVTIQGVASMVKLLVTPDSVALPANQSVNTAQVNGTTTDTNSGNLSAGTQRNVLATNSPSIPNAGQGATGSAPPAGAVYMGGNGSGATGGFMRGAIFCDQHALYDASDNGSKTIVAGVASRKIYVCGFTLATGGTATNLSLSSGTGTDCVTTSVNITPAYQLLANDKFGANTAFWNGLITLAAADNLCVKASAGNAHQAEVWFAVL